MLFKPKKSLGQNFLVDRNIQKKIIEHLALKTTDIILEIGSGRGELTRWLAGVVKKIYACEIDPVLCKDLLELKKTYPNIEIISQDILKFNLNRYFLGAKTKLKIVGNIPYYISTPIIEHLIKFRDKIDVIFITVQKEFAERIIGVPGTKVYGSLSCFVQYYTEPRIVLSIKKGCFRPQPKIDSCLVRLKIRTQPFLKAKHEKIFFKIVRAAFNQRRKILKNSLEGIVSADSLGRFFSLYAVNIYSRPENLSLEDFVNLAKIN